MENREQRRFVVSRLAEGPWLVLDRVHGARLVASCPLEDDANALAALMNRDPVDALKFVKFTLDRLDVMLLDRTMQSASPPIASTLPSLGKDD